MARKTASKTATGIKPDRGGWRVWQRVHPGPGGLLSKRFPKTATEKEMRAWQEAQRVTHRLKRPEQGAVTRGTLAADIAAYLKLVATMPSYSDRERDLGYWREVLGARRRKDLTANDYRRVLQEWRASGGKNGKALAASTVNHRRTAMMHLYTTLDGKGAPNPLRAFPAFQEPHPEPRDIGLATALAILAKVKPNKSGARLKVLAWTGIRGPSEFGQMKPAHLDLDAGTCWVPTGKGGKARHLLLNASGIAAWREVIATNAWGTYSASSLGKAFRRAVAKVNADRAKAKLPPLVGLRPYDLRHTIATALRKAGADVADVQGFLGHRSQKMTQRYAPYDSAKLRKAIDLLPTTVTHNDANTSTD